MKVLIIQDSTTSDESSTSKKGNKFKKSHSLETFKSLKLSAHNNSSSSLSSESSESFKRHTKSKKINFKLIGLFKYAKFIFTAAIIILIIFQAFYNIFVYNNKITINSISRLGVEKVFETNLKDEIVFNDKVLLVNQSLYFSFNQTELTPEEKEREIILKENNQIYEDEMFQFKETINYVYLKAEIPNLYCKKVPNTLQGYLDSDKILKDANLSTLIQFYDAKNKNKTIEKNKDLLQNSKNKNIAYRDLFYLNGTESIKENYTNEENWLLWNSNNMTGLLNMSKSYFGHDGQRVELGGHWKPNDCISNFKVAIIVPYRDRLPHLKVLLYYLHMVLQRQQLDYRIFVVEPTSPPEVRFNKGRVMNAAFLEALKIDPEIDCFVFHDVDLIPEDDRTMYTCPPKPRHLSAAIDKFDYVLPYNYLVGGVFVIRTETYREINGYSNQYWGWGAEDDDLSVRIKTHKLDIIRHPTKLARYKMIRHKQQKLNPQAHENLKKAKSRHRKDGVNTIKYEVVKQTLYTGFTHFLFDIGTLN